MQRGELQNFLAEIRRLFVRASRTLRQTQTEKTTEKFRKLLSI